MDEFKDMDFNRYDSLFHLFEKYQNNTFTSVVNELILHDQVIESCETVTVPTDSSDLISSIVSDNSQPHENIHNVSDSDVKWNEEPKMDSQKNEENDGRRTFPLNNETALHLCGDINFSNEYRPTDLQRLYDVRKHKSKSKFKDHYGNNLHSVSDFSTENLSLKNSNKILTDTTNFRTNFTDSKLEATVKQSSLPHVLNFDAPGSSHFSMTNSSLEESDNEVNSESPLLNKEEYSDMGWSNVNSSEILKNSEALEAVKEYQHSASVPKDIKRNVKRNFVVKSLKGTKCKCEPRRLHKILEHVISEVHQTSFDELSSASAIVRILQAYAEEKNL